MLFLPTGFTFPALLPDAIFSYNVADAKITFVNKGAVTDSQRKGWFTKIWEVLTPF